MGSFKPCQFYHPDTGACPRSVMDDSSTSSSGKFCYWHLDLVKDELGVEELESEESGDGFNLLGTSLTDLKLKERSFRRLQLESSQFLRGQFHTVDFRDSRFEETVLAYTGFVECELQNSEWSRTELNFTNIENCNLSGARFNDCSLESCQLVGSLLSKTRFQKTILRNLDFSQTDFYCSESYEQNLFPRFHSCKFSRCLFAGRDLSFLQFHNCEFSHCSFLDSRFSRTLFRDCIFYEVDFSGSLDLDRAYFESCSFQSSSLRSIREILPDFGKKE